MYKITPKTAINPGPPLIDDIVAKLNKTSDNMNKIIGTKSFNNV